MKLELSSEGANALRTLADAIPATFQNITEETDKMVSLCSSLSGDLGVHANAFSQLFIQVKAVVASAEESAKVLPPKMRETADKIDEYVRTSVED